MIGLMSVITSVISWLICIFAVISSIGVTVVLWITYNDVRNQTDDTIDLSLFDEFMHNETVLYATAIIATVIMVIDFLKIILLPINIQSVNTIHTLISKLLLHFVYSLFYLRFQFRFPNIQILVITIVCLIRKKLSGLAALFEEASNCMMDMPSLVIPSILASIVYALFLTFWVAVVVCLATAQYPGSKPLIPNAHGQQNIAEVAEANHPTLRYRNNTDPDYKSFKRIDYLEADVLQNMLWVYAIGLIWTAEFIFGKWIDFIVVQFS